MTKDWKLEDLEFWLRIKKINICQSCLENLIQFIKSLEGKSLVESK